MGHYFGLVFHLTVLLNVAESTVSAVTRSVHRRSDVLLSAICPAPCDQLLRARENSSLSPCGCDCPIETPVFLHTAGQCVDKLEECRTNIRFKGDDGLSAFIPVAVLPAKNGVLLPKWQIVWQEAGIRQKDGHANCTINQIFYENADHRWKAASRKLFALMSAGNRTSIIYKGSDAEVVLLTGAVVQMKLSCEGLADESVCLAFRVDGTSGKKPPHRSSIRWELVLAAVCCLLLIALLATFYLGFFCWKMEKRKLISRIQMQILYDYRRQQEAQSQANWGAVDCELGETGYKPVLLPKRRLLFHAEFLEREYLENPPEDAELFLIQLRRMVDAARERIRMRRFIPMLISIPELPEEEASPPPSPQSAKSVDSGRESSECSSEEPPSPRALRPSKLPLPKSVPPMPIIVPPRPPPPSKIPTPVSSVSPRAIHKTLSVSPAPSKSYRERKGYAVFPVDPMLNKSLPRRTKRSSIPAAKVPPPIPPKPVL